MMRLKWTYRYSLRNRARLQVQVSSHADEFDFFVGIYWKPRENSSWDFDSVLITDANDGLKLPFSSREFFHVHFLHSLGRYTKRGALFSTASVSGGTVFPFLVIHD
ncbi:hypothetical protein K504DRAFT_279182 [Pleomassaria siparia CBS 279.74]|uniref:Uncharacterized protein n=1 Tax=Pleomassaria siparia CBS 279.74 TaxID=1314801 RepID=A0A6G1KAJ9_9PLEO|nr:hypothetical protein K504DRAFT_279182 [Pleomassaria siparia CBS 279.74]